jgi:phosphoribosylformylglycinamidine synthase
MSEKGGYGMEIDLDKVPVREEGMTAYEMLLSESQERMLVVAEKGREQEIIDIYEKWDLNAVVIGEVVEGGNVTYYKDGEVKADIPADSLALGGGAPQYVREAQKPKYLEETQSFDIDSLNHPSDHKEVLKKLLGSPNIASKRWVYEQYDTMVRTNTVNGPGASDSGVVRIKGTNKALAVKTDCNGRYVYLNPRKGGEIAVAESARNVVCSGAKPMAITNCLNFGNPYKPEVYWTFKEALAGMGAACRALDTPVTGGNVSFYNENPEMAVFPTPVIGMLGLIEDLKKHRMTPDFKDQSDVIYYIGAERKGLGASEYLHAIHDLTMGDAPEIDLKFEARLQSTLLEAIQQQIVNAAHDISDGGLAITLAEMAIFSGKGASVSIEGLGDDRHEVLYSEAQSGVVVTCKGDQQSALEKHLTDNNVPFVELGKVESEGDALKIDDLITFSVDEMNSIYDSVIEKAMKQKEDLIS